MQKKVTVVHITVLHYALVFYIIILYFIWFIYGDVQYLYF